MADGYGGRALPMDWVRQLLELAPHPHPPSTGSRPSPNASSSGTPSSDYARNSAAPAPASAYASASASASGYGRDKDALTAGHWTAARGPSATTEAGGGALLGPGRLLQGPRAHGTGGQATGTSGIGTPGPGAQGMCAEGTGSQGIPPKRTGTSGTGEASFARNATNAAGTVGSGSSACQVGASGRGGVPLSISDLSLQALLELLEATNLRPQPPAMSDLSLEALLELLESSSPRPQASPAWDQQQQQAWGNVSNAPFQPPSSLAPHLRSLGASGSCHLPTYTEQGTGTGERLFASPMTVLRGPSTQPASALHSAANPDFHPRDSVNRRPSSSSQPGAGGGARHAHTKLALASRLLSSLKKGAGETVAGPLDLSGSAGASAILSRRGAGKTGAGDLDCSGSGGTSTSAGVFDDANTSASIPLRSTRTAPVSVSSSSGLLAGHRRRFSTLGPGFELRHEDTAGMDGLEDICGPWLASASAGPAAGCSGGVSEITVTPGLEHRQAGSELEGLFCSDWVAAQGQGRPDPMQALGPAVEGQLHSANKEQGSPFTVGPVGDNALDTVQPRRRTVAVAGPVGGSDLSTLPPEGDTVRPCEPETGAAFALANAELSKETSALGPTLLPMEEAMQAIPSAVSSSIGRGESGAVGAHESDTGLPGVASTHLAETGAWAGTEIPADAVTQTEARTGMASPDVTVTGVCPDAVPRHALLRQALTGEAGSERRAPVSTGSDSGTPGRGELPRVHPGGPAGLGASRVRKIHVRCEGKGAGQEGHSLQGRRDRSPSSKNGSSPGSPSCAGHDDRQLSASRPGNGSTATAQGRWAEGRRMGGKRRASHRKEGTEEGEDEEGASDDKETSVSLHSGSGNEGPMGDRSGSGLDGQDRALADQDPFLLSCGPSKRKRILRERQRRSAIACHVDRLRRLLPSSLTEDGCLQDTASVISAAADYLEKIQHDTSKESSQ